MPLNFAPRCGQWRFFTLVNEGKKVQFIGFACASVPFFVLPAPDHIATLPRLWDIAVM